MKNPNIEVENIINVHNINFCRMKYKEEEAEVWKGERKRRGEKWNKNKWHDIFLILLQFIRHIVCESRFYFAGGKNCVPLFELSWQKKGRNKTSWK